MGVVWTSFSFLFCCYRVCVCGWRHVYKSFTDSTVRVACGRGPGCGVCVWAEGNEHWLVYNQIPYRKNHIKTNVPRTPPPSSSSHFWTIYLSLTHSLARSQSAFIEFKCMRGRMNGRMDRRGNKKMRKIRNKQIPTKAESILMSSLKWREKGRGRMMFEYWTPCGTNGDLKKKNKIKIWWGIIRNPIRCVWILYACVEIITITKRSRRRRRRRRRRRKRTGVDLDVQHLAFVGLFTFEIGHGEAVTVDSRFVQQWQLIDIRNGEWARSSRRRRRRCYFYRRPWWRRHTASAIQTLFAWQRKITIKSHTNQKYCYYYYFENCFSSGPLVTTLL